MNYYAHLVDMPVPVEFYDAIHAETLRRTQGNVDGLLVHIARRAGAGFQLIEIWTDRDSYQRADRQLLTPIIASLAGPSPSPPGATDPHIEEFTPRGLVIPGGRTVL
jgi:hypothetical protein